ncbi:unnamed protein product [Urochloa humidicola]
MAVVVGASESEDADAVNQENVHVRLAPSGSVLPPPLPLTAAPCTPTVDALRVCSRLPPSHDNDSNTRRGGDEGISQFNFIQGSANQDRVHSLRRVLKFLIPVKLSIFVLPKRTILERYNLLEVSVSHAISTRASSRICVHQLQPANGKARSTDHCYQAREGCRKGEEGTK